MLLGGDWRLFIELDDGLMGGLFLHPPVPLMSNASSLFPQNSRSTIHTRPPRNRSRPHGQHPNPRPTTQRTCLSHSQNSLRTNRLGNSPVDAPQYTRFQRRNVAGCCETSSSGFRRRGFEVVVSFEYTHGGQLSSVQFQESFV